MPLQPPLVSSPQEKGEKKTATQQQQEVFLFISNILLFTCSMAVSLSASGLRALPSWSSSFSGDEHATLAMSVSMRPRSARPVRSAPRMGNVNEGKGLFAPIVVFVRNIIGRKRFNQLRGKAIALHSQVITEFCKTIGADSKQRQGLIRLAKKNGEKLGFLA